MLSGLTFKSDPSCTDFRLRCRVAVPLRSVHVAAPSSQHRALKELHVVLGPRWAPLSSVS